MEQPQGVDWTVLVLTCQYKDSVQVFQKELEVRQKRQQIPAGTLLLAVEDPEMRVGSGGATLNALLVAAEHLSARAGFTVVTADVLHSAWILILHMKTQSQNPSQTSPHWELDGTCSICSWWNVRQGIRSPPSSMCQPRRRLNSSGILGKPPDPS